MYFRKNYIATECHSVQHSEVHGCLNTYNTALELFNNGKHPVQYHIIVISHYCARLQYKVIKLTSFMKRPLKLEHNLISLDTQFVPLKGIMPHAGYFQKRYLNA